MEWYKRTNKGLEPNEKKELPDGLWIKCEDCGETLYKKELDRNAKVCLKCGHHFRMSAEEYIRLLADDARFDEFNTELRSTDPLKFKDSKKYSDRLKEAVDRTGLNDAVRTGCCSVNGVAVVMAVMDFSFIGGSMGSVVGEKICRAVDRALQTSSPMIIISASGGARMQEAAFSLMQMAKTAARLALLSDAGIPYISLLTDPTTGGTTASFSMLGDLIIAEPGALIGFAGPRVIKQTIGQDLPEGFQRAEFLLQHGFLDAIVPRTELKKQLSQMLNFFMDRKKKDSSSSMRILITNDDGIAAPGIAALAEAMSRIGQVTIVAPAAEMSAVGHAITLSDPLRVTSYEKNNEFFGYAVRGTPADCVKLAYWVLLKDQPKPDLLISGINLGANTGINVIYSGTVSAATEGAILGIPSFAISLATFVNPDFQPAAAFAVQLAQTLLQRRLPKGVFLNVNVPATPAEQIRGVRITRQGQANYMEEYSARQDPHRRSYYWLIGDKVEIETDERVDDRAILQNHISITPVHYDLTYYPLMQELETWGFTHA